MITAFLLAMALDSSLADKAPKFRAPQKSVEECLDTAYKLNHGDGTFGSGSMENGVLHFCAVVRFPT